MERKIGEIFEYNGEWYQCIKDTEYISCINCCFYNGGCKLCTDEDMGACVKEYRSDAKSICFKKLEKVGEPYRYQGMGIIMVQEYILANTNYIWEYSQDVVVMNFRNGKVAIEINQSKEDMKEKKLNIKPFDIQKAKAGKPVCTRDGRKARIICFDAKGGPYPVIALVEEGESEILYSYMQNGRRYEDEKKWIYDLMMLPEKKEGWVNIDKGGSGKITISSPYSTKEEAIHNDNETTIDTIKISWEE